jgi:hypothetical protein
MKVKPSFRIPSRIVQLVTKAEKWSLIPEGSLDREEEPYAIDEICVQSGNAGGLKARTGNRSWAIPANVIAFKKTGPNSGVSPATVAARLHKRMK